MMKASATNPGTHPLPSGEIHVWFRSLADTQPNLDPCAGLLSTDERTRAQRFYFERDRHRFILARAGLRQILSGYTDGLPQELAFTYSQFGKPYLTDAPDLFFNVSHSGDLAVYAVARGIEPGIDVEQVRADRGNHSIPEAFFAPAEVAALRTLDLAQQTEAFFVCWTRKEAYLKARATGLSTPLDSFEVSLCPGEPARFLRSGEGYSIASFRVSPDYVGAIVAPGNWTPRFLSEPLGPHAFSFL